MLDILIKEISKFKGNILGIGLSNKLADAVYDNEKIVYCDLLTNEDEKEESTKSNGEILNIRDLYKKYKSNLDFIIINYNKIKKYNIYILKYMNNLPNKKAIIYNIKNMDIYINRLNKLNIKYKKIDNILIITPNKKNKFKTLLYFYFDKLKFQIDKLIEILNN